MKGIVKCHGCGALVTVKPGAPGKAQVYHPHPLCSHVLALLVEGVADGPIVPATRDCVTGEIIEEPHGRSN